MKAQSASQVAALIKSATPEEFCALLERYKDDPRKQVQQALASVQKRLDRQAAEQLRVHAMYELQKELAQDGIALGVDEVGRGSIAGPLTVCAVALPNTPELAGLNDSKKLTPAARELLAAQIAETALTIGICHISPQDIDTFGMASSIVTAMQGAIKDALSKSDIDPAAVLIDGNPVHADPREKTIVKGDSKVACIAAASIVAKVTRDALMSDLDVEYPQYHWAECKGYASAAHIAAIKEHGLSEHHRVSFCDNFIDEMRLF